MSHRQLALPEDGSEDLLKQFRMLQHLQNLVDQQSGEQASGNWVAPPSINSALLERLRGMLTPDQQQLLESKRKRMERQDGLDDGAITELESVFEKLFSEPNNSRDLAQEMLRRFSKDRQLPSATRGEADEKDIVPPTANKVLPNELPTLNKSSDFLPPLTQQPDLSQTLNTSPPGRQPNDNRATDDRATDDKVAANYPQTVRTPLPTVPELLKQTKQDPTVLPSFQFPANSLSLEELKRLLSARLTSSGKQQGTWLNSLKDSLPAGLKEELHQSGVGQSLREVMNDFNHGSRGNGSQRNTADSTVDLKVDPQNLGLTLESINQELQSLAESRTAADKQSASANSVIQHTTAPYATTNEPNRQSEPGFWKRASGLFNELMPSQEKTSSQPTIKSANAKSPEPHKSQAGSNSQIILMAIVSSLSMAAAGFWLLGSRKAQRSQGVWTGLAATNITTRSELVQAFHRMIGTSGTSFEDWWTHRRAAIEISKVNSSATSDLEFLSELYEIARYGPTDYQFTDEQFQQARRALEQVVKC